MRHARTRAPIAALTIALTAATATAAGSGSGPTVTSAAADQQTTTLISRALDGGIPNGPSTHAVISLDKRYARAIAFESEASDLVHGDTNRVKDVFAIRRAGKVGNRGSTWHPGSTRLLSRARGGAPANGPSFSPSISGGFHARPRCVGFLSAASNIARHDSNGQVDAFVARLKGGTPRRISLPRGRQSAAPTSAVAVSSTCRKIAFVTGGKLYVKRAGHRRPRRIRVRGAASDPSFSVGLRDDLVFGARGRIYLSKKARRRPRRIARHGRNPAFNDIKRHVVTYERRTRGHRQIMYKELGHRPHIISSRGSHAGNGDSRNPVIGNSGYYVTFETDASNLGVNANGRSGDYNRAPDSYLYTNVRDITLVQSVEDKAVPLHGGGRNPSMSFYANYIVFDSPAPLDENQGAHQIYMRYLGPV